MAKAKKAAKRRGALGGALLEGADQVTAAGFGDARPTKGPKNRQGDTVSPTAFRISTETMATLRGASFMLGRTIASLVEDALREHLAALEKKHGPFPRPKA